MKLLVRPLKALSTVAAILFAFLFADIAHSQGKLTIFALQREGQASIAIDRDKHRAFVVDLGGSGDGNKLLYEGIPLMDWLAKNEIHEVYFECSHPHRDHNGGVAATFKDPTSFFEGGDKSKPRFTKIGLIDDAGGKSLAAGLKTLASGTKLEVEYTNLASAVDANGVRVPAPNAYEKITSPANAIHIETIPYDLGEKAGAHGRSLVTLFTLGGNYRLLDFDDASTSAIKKAVAILKARKITIDAFVVPHHGSEEHNITPILDDLKPRTAILTANFENQYGHPRAAILRELLERLDHDQVMFTGSTHDIVFGPNGVEKRGHTAADPDAYALLVESHRAYEEKQAAKDKRPFDAKEFEKIYALLRHQPPDMPTPPTQTPSPGMPGGGGGVVDEYLRQRAGALGSMLTPEHVVGQLGKGGDEVAALVAKRPFALAMKAPEGKDIPITLIAEDAGSADVVLSAKQAAAAADTVALSPIQALPGEPRALRINYETEAGVPSIFAQPKKANISSAAKPLAGEVALPNGGMVFLAGGKVVPAGIATELNGSVLDFCEGRLCIRRKDSTQTYTVPFEVDELFAEVWRKTYDHPVDAFYLSINPTHEFIESIEESAKQVPTDRLAFGSDKAEQGSPINEVVTAGDIETSPIGRVLWEADVAFKSQGLGFNVLSGEKDPNGLSNRVLIGDESVGDMDLSVSYENRWCRLYWKSGDQKLEIDSNKHAIVLRGRAALARAEAMTLEGGELKPFPQGGWCLDAKQIAKQLEQRAYGPAPEQTLRELRKIAEVRNFAAWALNSDIAITPMVKSRIDETKPESYQVPRWTSGVRNDPRLAVQLQRRTETGNKTQMVHVSFAFEETISRCVEPLWQRVDVDFPKAGLEFNKKENRWMGSMTYVDGWMTRFAANIAKCARGVQLTPDVWADFDGLIAGRDTTSQVSTFGYELHPQPFAVHGGVMLGTPKTTEFIESAWRDTGQLDDPQGMRLFKIVGDDIHLWHPAQELNDESFRTQHIVVRNGRVAQALALGGHLILAIQAQPGAVVREEVRVTARRPFGTEWVRTRHGSDGAMLIEKSASLDPCPEGAYEECLVVRTNNGDAVFGKDDSLEKVPPALSITHVGSGLWIAKFDISYMKQGLIAGIDDDSPQELRDRARALARWGFAGEAERIRNVAIENLAEDSVDTMMRESLGATSLENLRVAYAARVATDNLRSALGNPGSPMPINRLRRALDLVAKVAETDRVLQQYQLSRVCDQMEENTRLKRPTAAIPKDVVECIATGQVARGFILSLLGKLKDVEGNAERLQLGVLEDIQLRQ